MTIAQNVTAKLVVGLVVVSMLFSLSFTSAKAATAEELQAQITTLLSQIAQLQGQLGQGGTGVGAGVCPFTWTMDLKTGSAGADVMKLQQFLNSDPETRVAASGVGSAGMETMTYGPMTAAAVSKFQTKYSGAILAPAGLVNPTGFFGPGTRAKANMLCASAPAPSDDDSNDDSNDDANDDDSSDELSGEADLDTASLDSASDDEVEEGAEDAEIATFNVEFQDGDASISRIDVMLDSGDTSDAWDALESVSLWVDGDKVAETNADDEDDYQDDEMTLRFSGLDIVAMEDEEVEVVIAATLQSNIDAADQDTYTVSIPSMRFFDAEGVASTEEDPTTDTVTFDIVAAGFEDEVIVKSSNDDPEATTLQVEDSAKSDWFTVFVFDLDTDDSTNDIELNTIDIEVITGNDDYAAVVDDAELVIDGVTVDDFDVVISTTTDPADTGTLTFDVDGDVVIDAGERVAAELKLRFKALVTEGATVEASVDGTTIDAEGADDVTGEGASTGETHTLRTTGIEVELDSTDADITVVDSTDNDYGTFVISVDVTAFEQEVFIPISAASTTWKLADADGATILSSDTASTTVVLDSTAAEGGAGDAFFEINEGETETITLTVTYTPGASAPQSARLVLETLVFDETGTATGADDEEWDALPATTYRTSVISIQD